MRMACVGLTAWVISLGAVAPAKAADPELTGHWEGLLKPAPGIELRMIINVSEEGGKLKATLDSPDQGAVGLPADSIAVKDGELTFGRKAIQAEYKGKLDAKGTEIVGTFTQRGRATPLTLKKVDKPDTLTIPAELFGIWEGKLKAGAGIELRMFLKVEKLSSGGTTAAFVSADQTPTPLPIDKLTLIGTKVVAASKAIRSEFQGTLNAGKTEIAGEWKQGGASLPLTLKKTDKVTEPKRPQTPKPPFSYRSEDVTYPDKEAKFTLAGTLTLPKGMGPFPVVIMITGSGSQDRDETLLGHKPFLVIADSLTKRGIAVLRVDDRGVGGSTGDPLEATTMDFAGDVRAGIAYLKTRKEIDPKRIGLVGHSEGGIIAPMVAAGSDDVAFIVLLAGTGMDGAEILKAQTRLIFKAGGGSDASVAMQLKVLDAILGLVVGPKDGKKDPKDAKADAAKLEALARAAIALIPESERKAMGDLSTRSIEQQIARVNSPWFRFFLTFDPKTVLAKVRCPVLAINGSKDLQVPCKDNLAAIESALRSGGNKSVTIKEFPGLNHLFQPCNTGAPSEYNSIEQTIDPAVLTVLGDWITATAGKK
jgi:pimeloyl-ACP methyl ester carboxylesterase